MNLQLMFIAPEKYVLQSMSCLWKLKKNVLKVRDSEESKSEKGPE
jgi:hypothetical protein